MTYETLTQAVIVLPAGEAIFSELATTIALEDEGAGPFVVVSQDGRDGTGKVTFDLEEWPDIRQAIDRMMDVCKQRKQAGEERGNETDEEAT